MHPSGRTPQVRLAVAARESLRVGPGQRHSGAVAAHTHVSSSPACQPRHLLMPAQDYLDHFETTDQALADLEPALYRLATHLGKTKAELRVYDPVRVCVCALCAYVYAHATHPWWWWRVCVCACVHAPGVC
jgi:hypothetical protein